MSTRRFSFFRKPFFPVVSISILFLLVQLRTLMDFPYVHSDEVWLMEIAHTMLQNRSFSITEGFFDLYPRTIHPFRWSYNLMLMPFLLFVGPKALSVRLLSLLGATLCLLVFDRLLLAFSWRSSLRFVAVTALALNIQFIYSAHLGRQETWILFFLLLEVLLIVSRAKPWAIAGALLVSGGIHPNSFLIGLVVAFLLLAEVLQKKEQAVQRLGRVTLYLLVGALVYLAVGLRMNPHFLTQYLAFGASFGTDATPLPRLQGFLWYFFKLYHQIGGTYVLMDIRLYLLGGALFLLLWMPLFLIAFWHGPNRGFAAAPLQTMSSYSRSPAAQGGHVAFICLLAFALGLFLMGRYNQTAIVFGMPFFLLLACLFLDLSGCAAASLHLLDRGFLWHRSETPAQGRSLFQKAAPWLMAALVLVPCASNTVDNIRAYDRQHFYAVSYREMLWRLKDLVPHGAVVLGNLNTIEAFDATRFYDVRNLGLLASSGSSAKEYLRQRKVEYVVLHQEMEYLYDTRPRWEFLYGNMGYYPELKEFLQQHAVCVGTFENPTYAMRLARYSGTYPWTTSVYRLDAWQE